MNLKNKTILPIIAIVIVVIIAAVILPPGAQTNAKFAQNLTNETNHVRMGYIPLVHGLPVYLAIDNNYFTKEGIEIEMIKFEAPNQLIDAIMQDKIDFISTNGASGIAAVADSKNPGKLKLFALTGGSFENPNEALLVPMNSTITKISDLKGKKLGILAGTIQWRTIARDMLNEAGLVADKDVTLAELAPAVQAQALATGQVDALLALEPIIAIVKQKNIGKEIEHAPMEHIIANPFYPGSGIISTSFAEKNPTTAKKFIEVVNKATKEIEANPIESRKHLKNWTVLTDEIIDIAYIPTIKTCNEITAQDIEALQKFYDIFTEFGVVEGKLSAEAIMYCKAA
ncbi:MAG: ABC transporter substrate-binding protein [Candidatus Diapherotrites archaeon]|nr:ABC transporter substrate-binding protein [Candidatus Diapherotrites archaeon]